MLLQQELTDLEASKRAKRPAPITAIMDQATQSLSDAKLAEQILTVGEKAPVFSLPNAKGEQVQLAARLKQGPVILSFYRGGWCPYCNLELQALQRQLPEFEALGAQLLAISPETPDNSLSTAEKNALAFEVLSDEDNRVAKAYRLVFELPEDLRKVYAKMNIKLTQHNGVDRYELPLPASYVIAPDGEVVYAFAHADYTKRAEPQDILAALKKLKLASAPG